MRGEDLRGTVETCVKRSGQSTLSAQMWTSGFREAKMPEGSREG